MTLQTSLPPTQPAPGPGNAPLPPVMPPPGQRPGLPSPRRRQTASLFNTHTLLGQFRSLAALIVALTAIALLVSFWVLSNLQNDFRRVITKLTPSIVAGQQLGQALEDMDSRAADYQLTSRIDVTNPDFQAAVYNQPNQIGLRETAWNDLENRRRIVDNQLSIARTKAVSGDSTELKNEELDALNRIANRFYEYYAKINLMRYELDQGHKETALANYKAAEDILVGNLGLSPRDVNGNSKEKVLKDNGWSPTTFSCVTNCQTAELNKAVPLSFEVSLPYDGLAANVHKLAEINRTRLDHTSGQLSPILVWVTAVLVALMTIVISAYYAFITHRVLNLGFALAMVAGLALAITLITSLNSATRDYNNFKTDFVEGPQGIVQTSTIQQISADANADLSRLLLSPDSPGLDSTQPALTTDVKRAFSRDTLLSAYENKRKLVQKLLDDFSNSEASRNWSAFTAAGQKIQDAFRQRLLATAILIDISPNPANAQLDSARLHYNQFTAGVSNNGVSKQTAFDLSACNSIGQREFSQTTCNSPGGGYLNLLQLVVWIVFPLVALLVAGGIVLTSRLF